MGEAEIKAVGEAGGEGGGGVDIALGVVRARDLEFWA